MQGEGIAGPLTLVADPSDLKDRNFGGSEGFFFQGVINIRESGPAPQARKVR